MRNACRLLLLVAASGAAAWPQPAEPTFEVAGDVKHPLRLTKADLAAMPRVTVQANDHGVAKTYEGVWLHEILKRAGAPGGTALTGKAVASYLLATAEDSYQVVFSLAEVDPLFTDNQILLADSSRGKPLAGSEGPFRLVAPKEKRGARSIRMLTKLQVVLLRK